MAHKILLPMDDAAYVFGTYFPTLEPINWWKQASLISLLIKAELGSNIEASFNGDKETPLIIIQVKDSVLDVAEAYKLALGIEDWVDRLSRSKLDRFKTKIRNWRNKKKPSNLFCIDDIEFVDLMRWIKSHNISVDDYRIFTKFNNDTSITFRNDQQATMFKLEFG